MVRRFTSSHNLVFLRLLLNIETPSTLLEGIDHLWLWFLVISTIWNIKEPIPCLIIWNVEYFYSMYIFVWTRFFFKLSFFFRLTTRRRQCEVYANDGTLPTIWQGISKLHLNQHKVHYLQWEVLQWGVPQLSRLNPPGPNPLLLGPDGDYSYCTFSD